MSISTASSTTSVGLYVSNGTSGLTSGSLVRVAASGTGTLATNGVVSIRHAGIAVSTSNAGVLDVQASAAVGAMTLVNIMATAASQTATNLLNLTQSGATITAYTSSLVSMTGGFSGGSSTGNILGITAVNTSAGDAVKIVSNALTAGTSTLLNLSHTTSVLGAGNSMLRITSTSADTGSTTGTLLDLAQTGIAVGNVAVLLTDASSSVAARSGLKIAITNSAAVLATPLVITNAGATGTGSKFKIVANFAGYNVWVSTDGTSPNGALGQTQSTNVTAGDICLGTTGGKIAYCSSAASNGTWAVLT